MHSEWPAIQSFISALILMRCSCETKPEFALFWQEILTLMFTLCYSIIFWQWLINSQVISWCFYNHRNYKVVNCKMILKNTLDLCFTVPPHHFPKGSERKLSGLLAPWPKFEPGTSSVESVSTKHWQYSFLQQMTRREELVDLNYIIT